MKKTILSIALGLIALFTVTTSFAAGKITAADVKRYETGKGSIVVAGNITSVFNQKGKFIYSISRYSADNLPKDIFDVVRKNYGQFYIAGMEKVEQRNSNDVYIVHLEDNTSIKTLRVSNGETELVQDFVKG